MSTVTAILEPDADGTVHVPVPAGLPQGKVKVTATFEPPRSEVSPDIVRQRMVALERLRQLNPFREIADPVAWQREIRQDRQLPGRD